MGKHVTNAGDVPASEKQLISISDAVREGWASDATLRRLIKKRQVPYYRIGSRYFFKREELAATFKQMAETLSTDQVAGQVADMFNIEDKDGFVERFNKMISEEAHRD